MNCKVLITGIAGFIGFHTAKKFLQNNYDLIGIDNLNDYYDVNLKHSRIDELKKYKSNTNDLIFIKCDLENNSKLESIFEKYQPKIVINLAAQAGVRYSLINPQSYVNSNLVGFANVLEACRRFNIKNLIYASSSSVYGNNINSPFKETDKTQKPLSLYGATKSANELMAYSYSNLFNISCIGLRFFTVYGPWGRPDMAPMIFANLISNKKPIEVFNYGKMQRDFTFIDDIVEGIYRCCIKNKEFLLKKNSDLVVPHRVFNIGNSNPISLMKFIDLLENEFNYKTTKEFKPLQAGDVVDTYADSSELSKWIGFSPQTSLEDGIKRFANWYKKYYLK